MAWTMLTDVGGWVDWGEGGTVACIYFRGQGEERGDEGEGEGGIFIILVTS